LRLVVKIPLLQNIAFYGVSKKGVEAID
jgi:hypothetical protein